MFSQSLTLKRRLVFAGMAMICGYAYASDPLTIEVRGDQFFPRELSIPANQKVKIQLHNNSSVPIEFESVELSREIVVPANDVATVYVGPLPAGRYPYFNDEEQTMTGLIVAAP